MVGTLEGLEEIEVGPLVDGRVERILHDVGDVVAPGDVLLQINDSDHRLAVAELQRGLELQLARLGVDQPPGDEFDVQSLPSVRRAQLTQDNESRTFERTRTLWKQKVSTQDELDKAETRYQVAVTDSREQLLQAHQSIASVRQSQAMLDSARKKLGDTEVKVPELYQMPYLFRRARQDGSTDSPAAVRMTVESRMISEGEIARSAPPTSLFKLVADDTLKLVAQIPERHVHEVQLNQPVKLQVESDPQQQYVGRVARLNPTVDRNSRTLQIEVEVPNSDHLLKAGSFATAAILVGEQQQALTVPEEAVVRFAGVVKVFVVRNEQAIAVPVDAGTRLDVASGADSQPWVEVTGALSEGDSVVTTGHSQLADQTPVQLRQEILAPAPADRSATTRVAPLTTIHGEPPAAATNAGTTVPSGVAPGAVAPATVPMVTAPAPIEQLPAETRTSTRAASPDVTPAATSP